MTDTHATPSRTGPIIGRDRDLAVLRTFVDELSTNGSALLVTGDAGTGKSTLLAAAARMAGAAGIRVVRVSGTESTAEVAFAVLDRLLAELHVDLSRSSPGHQRALTVALGFDDGPTPRGMVLANAVLELLSRPSSAPARSPRRKARWLCSRPRV